MKLYLYYLYRYWVKHVSLLLLFVGQTLDLTTLTCFKYKDEQGVQQRIHIIDDMAPRWKEVGTMLKFSEPDIDNIESNCHGDAVKCCRKLLSLWLQGQNDSNDSCPKTWKTLLEVMQDARLGQLADKLKTHLLDVHATTQLWPSLCSFTCYVYGIPVLFSWLYCIIQKNNRGLFCNNS